MRFKDRINELGCLKDGQSLLDDARYIRGSHRRRHGICAKTLGLLGKFPDVDKPTFMAHISIYKNVVTKQIQFICGAN